MNDDIQDKLLDELLKSYREPGDLLGPEGLFTQLKKRLINRVLESELTTHLGYEKHGHPPADGPSNSRNGHTSKTLRSDEGKLEIKVPRDRKGRFEPALVPKHERQFDGFDDTILSLYARGLSVREIQAHLLEIYQVEVSTDLISNATDAVAEEVRIWQNRPLEAVYPVVWFDAIMVKVRHEGKVANRAIYLALALNLGGRKELLGMWSSENEGARFWLQVATELKNRGLSDIFICCVDGLNGFARALETVYPKTRVQRCVVHLLRHSLSFVNWKERKAVADALKPIYQAPTAEAARAALDDFRSRHDARFPAIGRSWEARGTSSFPSSTTRRNCANSSTPPTPSNRSTVRCGAPPATAIRSPRSIRFTSCFTWHSSASAPNGPRPPPAGTTPSTASPSNSGTACPATPEPTGQTAFTQN